MYTCEHTDGLDAPECGMPAIWWLKNCLGKPKVCDRHYRYLANHTDTSYMVTGADRLMPVRGAIVFIQVLLDSDPTRPTMETVTLLEDSIRQIIEHREMTPWEWARVCLEIDLERVQEIDWHRDNSEPS